MTAQSLDGKAPAAVRRSAAGDSPSGWRPWPRAGIVPGLGTVLVGDDPGSRAYVNGKHRDCAAGGHHLIRRDLPADATQAQVEAVVDELNADPACTGYIVQLPLPAGLDAHRRAEPDGPGQGRGRPAPGQPGPAGPGRARPAAVHPARDRGTAAPLRGRRSPAPTSPSIGRGITVGRALGPAAHPPDENATVTLCHTGTKDLRRAHPARRHRGRGGRRARAAHRGHGQARRGRGRRRHHQDRRRRWSATWPPRSPRWPAGWPRCRAASAR